MSNFTPKPKVSFRKLPIIEETSAFCLRPLSFVEASLRTSEFAPPSRTPEVGYKRLT
jgi:hypothetical protein